MVELLVVMTISLLVCLTVVSSLRLAVKNGSKEWFYTATPGAPSITSGLSNPAPHITGFDNALIDSTDPLNHVRPRAEGSEAYGSDILIVRHQVAEAFPDAGISDPLMIDCSGKSTDTPVNRQAHLVSILHVAINQKEPTLMCSYSATGAAPFTTIPLVQGVENFQVLYGTNTVTPVTPSPPATTAGAADIFLRANQLTVAGNPADTNNNWRRVRSLRIGLVLRGPPGSDQNKVARTLYPLGKAKSSVPGNAGSAIPSADDPGTVFKAPADGRLRQVVTFTVHLPNDQSL